MPKAYYPAKITLPVNNGILRRKHLYNEIDRKREKKIIWIEGPPGSGKSTLVSSYIEDRGLPCIWYQLDAGDADPASFFYYMGMAVKKASPRKRKPMPLLTPEYLPGVPVFTRRYFEELCKRVRSSFILVLDNYQDVPPGSMFHEMIVHGLEAVSAGINVIMISRTGPPGSMARLKVNSHIETIGWNDLQFSLKEAEAMISLRNNKIKDRKMIREIHKKADGWISGLILMLEQTEAERYDLPVQDIDTPDIIFDYFAGEIFSRMQKRKQDFLIKTAFIPGITSKMAIELTGVKDAGRILSGLSRNNYFTVKHHGHNPGYAYHPLFREFLIQRANEIYTPSQLQNIKRKAAAILEGENMPENAVRLFMESKDIESTVKTILNHAPLLFSQGRHRVLKGWLEMLSQDIMQNEPWLEYWLGACRMIMDPAEGRGIFEKTLTRFKERGDIPGMFLSWSGAVDSIMYELGSYKEFDKWITVFDKELKGVSFPGPEIETRVTISMLSAMVFVQPVHPDLDTWLEKGLALSKAVPDVTLKATIYLPVVLSCLTSGDMEKAGHYLKMFAQVVRSPNVTPLALVTMMSLEAYYYWHAARFEECSDKVHKGLKLAADSGVHVLDFLLLCHGVTGALGTGETGKAEAYLEMIVQNLKVVGDYQKNVFHLIATWYTLISGNISEGIFHSETALELSLYGGVPYNLSCAYVGAAFIKLANGSPREALGHIEKAHDIAGSNNFRQVEFSCMLMKARLAFEQGKRSEGKKMLSRAMSLGKENNYMNFLYWESGFMADLCVRALEAGIEVAYLRELIRKRGLVPAEPPIKTEEWPWLLSIYSLGRFEIVADGKPVKFSGKAQKKPLEMLKALIACGGRNVPAALVMDALWPDAAGDSAQQSFRTTLHRLRKLLGNESVLKFREGFLSFDHDRCWLDTWAFKRCLELSDTAYRKKQIDRSMHLYKKAMGLYKGHFLESDMSDPSTISFRERLKSKFLRHVGKYGRMLEEAGEWRKAVECYQKALEVDDLTEDFYRHLMVCNHKLGRRAEAIAVYNRCRETLSAILRVEPSSKTVDLYNSLLK